MVGGAALGAMFGEVFNDTVKSVGSYAFMFKPILKSLQFNLNLLAPVVKEIRQLNKKLDHPKGENNQRYEEGPGARWQFGAPRVGLSFTSLLRETTYKVE